MIVKSVEDSSGDIFLSATLRFEDSGFLKVSLRKDIGVPWRHWRQKALLGIEVNRCFFYASDGFLGLVEEIQGKRVCRIIDDPARIVLEGEVMLRPFIEFTESGFDFPPTSTEVNFSSDADIPGLNAR